MRRLVTPTFVLIHLAALHLLVLFFLNVPLDDGPISAAPEWVGQILARPGAAADDRQDPPEAASGEAPAAPNLDAPSEAGAEADPPALAFDPPGDLSLESIEPIEGRLVADLGNGWSAELTLDPIQQRRAKRLLDRGRVPLGAIVVLDIDSGEVLALADRFDADHPHVPELDPNGPPHLALRAVAPAASVFKIVTATALLESGLSATRRYRYQPARRRIRKAHLGKLSEDAPSASLSRGFAHSNNGLFARLANQKLDRATLRRIVARFGFNRVVPFPLLTDASTAVVPRGRLERARMAAGFWHSRLTPLHAALLAAAVANGGVMPAPRLVSRLRDPIGAVVEPPPSAPFAQALDPKTARVLRKMMARTVREGTARRAFRRKRKSLGRLKVAGKTGTLAARDPYIAYTWFVGFAPADKPEIAFAVLVGNGPLWHVRAVDVAADLMAGWFSAAQG